MRAYWLYVVTDDNLSARTHVEQAESAYLGGADVVQLRDKHHSRNIILEEATSIAEIARRLDRTFIVNDDVDIAIESGATGVHLGKTDGSISKARADSPAGFIIGASVESVEDAMKAEGEGADYVALSPVFDTTTKSDAHSGYGLEILSEIKRNVSVPVIAIGGINFDNVEDVIDAGADGAAMVSAIVAQNDIEGSARKMRERIIASRDRR